MPMKKREEERGRESAEDTQLFNIKIRLSDRETY